MARGGQGVESPEKNLRSKSQAELIEEYAALQKKLKSIQADSGH